MNRDSALNDLATRMLTAQSGVYIPGLGVFNKKRDPVRKSLLSNRLEPPQIRWYLNRRLLNAGASTLVSQWGYASSVLIDEVPADWTQPFNLPGLGRIVPSAVGEGRLEPEHPLLLHFLASYRFPAIVPPTRSGFHVLPNELSPSKAGTKGIKFKKTRTAIGWAAVWVAFLLPALLLLLQYHQSNDIERAGLGQPGNRHDTSLLPDFPRLYPPVDTAVIDTTMNDTTVIDTAVLDTTVIDSSLIIENTVVNIQPVVPPPSNHLAHKTKSKVTERTTNSSTPNTVIVVGCFLSKRNAERQESRLVRAGFVPAVLQPSKGGLHRVGALCSVRKASEVDSVLEVIRRKIHPDAWVLEAGDNAPKD